MVVFDMEYKGSNDMYKIMIVEDDFTIAESVSGHLQKWGFETKCIEDFMNVMDVYHSFGPDLILMDINLPYYNGFHWCSEIRRVSTTPIIFVSSISDNMNIVMAMNMGEMSILRSLLTSMYLRPRYRLFFVGPILLLSSKICCPIGNWC